MPVIDRPADERGGGLNDAGHARDDADQIVAHLGPAHHLLGVPLGIGDGDQIAADQGIGEAAHAQRLDLVGRKEPAQDDEAIPLIAGDLVGAERPDGCADAGT